MLSRFDWLRRSRTGAELLATLQYLEAHPEFPDAAGELGPPPSALHGPCLRCWLYPRLTTTPGARYCSTCRALLDAAWQGSDLSRHAVVVWGFVNQLPRQLGTPDSRRDPHLLGTYVHDENRFLVMLYYLGIKPWLQELAIYHGTNLKGLLQIFPTTGTRDLGMGDILCRVMHQEARFPPDRLRIRFYSTLQKMFAARFYDRQEVLTFEAAEFLHMLERASVFQSVLKPDEQAVLFKLLNMKNLNEAQFYWGRFLGSLTQEARDMVTAWKLRQWPKPQIHLLYELVNYVEFYQPRSPHALPRRLEGQ